MFETYWRSADSLNDSCALCMWTKSNILNWTGQLNSILSPDFRQGQHFSKLRFTPLLTSHPVCRFLHSPPLPPRFKGQPLDFFGALRASMYDSQIRDWIVADVIGESKHTPGAHANISPQGRSDVVLLSQLLMPPFPASKHALTHQERGGALVSCGISDGAHTNSGVMITQ